MNKSLIILKQKRNTFGDVGTNVTKRMLWSLSEQNRDIIAYVYYIALHAVEYSIIADSYSGNEICKYDCQKKYMYIMHLHRLYGEYEELRYEYERIDGVDYTAFYLPYTNDIIRFPGTGLPGEYIGANSEYYHISNLNSVETSIQRVFSDLISKKKLAKKREINGPYCPPLF